MAATLATRALHDQGLAFAVRAGTLVVSVLAGLAAAVMPARRASRLDPLGALQYE